MPLHFRQLHTGYWWANADGTTEEQLGRPGYVVQQARGLWQAIGPEVDLPDQRVLASGLQSRREAMALCEKDLPMYERALAGG